MIHRKGSLLALEDGVANTPHDKKEEMVIESRVFIIINLAKKTS